ncbi:cytochrome C oxidase subunit IV family protein [Bordetella sp. BOR01]|uniref:cytochrome C oxidase subunit IV family protein n=1 Tax=Bordetella sp. BOR01 TaxID=2854779 RepID=UPI001C4620B4|nr:cytochrome C oxidase subunit IV family protein [Bordetella sp. BOR01]MBV7483613.1 cytochrome C oxidase subunit IV family protein [Bordetella sp. BOR01]
MSETVRLLCYWLGLVVLTVATVSAAGGAALPSLQGWVIALAVAKAWLVIDGFMELRHAPRAWRLLLLAWPLAMAAGVLLAGYLPGR